MSPEHSNCHIHIMDLTLQRTHLAEDYTMGVLASDGRYLCDTVEDKVRDYNKDGDLEDEGEDKVYGRTAIPYGRYQVLLTMSPKFTRLLPLLVDVPGFTGIRIHRGNRAEDSHGCILVGEKSTDGVIINSTKHEMKIVELIFEAYLNSELIHINII